MRDTKTTLAEIKYAIDAFATARDWKQYHSPKNLSMALAVEAAELMEIFQWCTTEESANLYLRKAAQRRIEEELADIASYCIELCNVLGIDLSRSIERKLRINARKYPMRAVHGKKKKVTA